MMNFNVEWMDCICVFVKLCWIVWNSKKVVLLILEFFCLIEYGELYMG